MGFHLLENIAKSPQSRVPSSRGMFSQGHVSKLSDMFSQDGNYSFIELHLVSQWCLMVVSNYISNSKLGDN